ncbi:MAG: sigma-70 family RNA polymerase sigma factor [Pirellulaceae bacterium]|nr:sigma-70 family RNA polymerase sigma factor [Pirellulaceae bacterium]
MNWSIDSTASTWLRQARAGDSLAWRKLVRVYRPLICWWCARGGVAVQDIDDVAQEVLGGVASALEGFERESFRGFLWGIARHKIADYWRTRHAQAASPGGSTMQQLLAELEAESEQLAGANDQATKIVFDAVVELIRGEFSERDWSAFWQVTVEEKSAADVADSLGITTNMVYLAKTRIKRRIREEFGDAGP